MCGIFGILINKNSNFGPSSFKNAVGYLFELSESRGKEAAGIALLSNDSIKVYKSSIPASRLIRSDEYHSLFARTFSEIIVNNKFRSPLTLIGHARLMTNGALAINTNNQPVIKNGIVGVHNGIIVNDDALWEKFPELRKEYEVDTEIILALIRMFLNNGNTFAESIKTSFNLIEGSASIAVLFNDKEYLVLGTNTGSLYLCENDANSVCIFASELNIIKNLLKKHNIENLIGRYRIRQIEPGTGCIININNLKVEDFSFINKDDSITTTNISKCNIKNIVDLSSDVAQNHIVKPQSSFTVQNPKIDIASYYKMVEPISKLKRCTRCILPETMPFIEFDDDGVCNYCKSYKKIEPKGEIALQEIVNQYKSKNKEPDCIVMFSGGRDSSYSLHYIKTVLGMNPVAYSYDWGMITDLGRRNQARMCGTLGIEHILISADINKKRENIRKNVEAWLKKPDLGTVPLFMAGDKQFFYYANKLKTQMNIKLIIIGSNLLEKTNFKSGFCGIKPVGYSLEHLYNLSMIDKINLAAYYGKQYLSNVSYLNNSLFDTLDAFLSYYFIKHDYLNIYKYIEWNEKIINATLIREYNWELADDTKTTWRIGDGTAAFYNYIYYTVAGFTENDTFRSNQIREGLISRQEGLNLIKEENKPRYEAIKWYCDTIGIDFAETIEIINSIPKLYKGIN